MTWSGAGGVCAIPAHKRKEPALAGPAPGSSLPIGEGRFGLGEGDRVNNANCGDGIGNIPDENNGFEVGCGARGVSVVHHQRVGTCGSADEGLGSGVIGTAWINRPSQRGPLFAL